MGFLRGTSPRPTELDGTDPSTTKDSEADRRGRIKGAKAALKGVVAALVLLALGWYVRKTWHELSTKGWSFRVEPGGLVAASALYLAGLSGFGVFFWRVMGASPTPMAFRPALRAYLIGHLGKYVPGKALVVVMRVGLATPYGARPATTAFATLYETLVMMAAGSLAATIGFALGGQVSWPLALSFGLAIGFLVLVEPRIFPRVSALISVPFPNVGPEALPRFSHRLLGEGLLWCLAGWTLLGLSQVEVVRAMGLHGLPPERWPLVIASVALATVAGFAIAVLPGGFGVREGILMVTLAPAIGREMAVVAALVLRLTWVASEALAGAVLYLVRPSITPRPAEP